MEDEGNLDLTAFEIDAIARRGDLQHAFEMALEMINSGAYDDEVYFVASDIAFQLGDLDKAEQLVNSLLVLDPEHLAGWSLFGDICARKNNIIREGHARQMIETLFPAMVNHDPAPAEFINVDNNNRNQNNQERNLDFDTLTFADICVTQGYFHKALKIYQDQLKKYPDDRGLQKKIEDIEKKLGGND